jgi:subtilase family serine protease
VVSLRKVVVSLTILCATVGVSSGQAVLQNRITQPLDRSQMVRLRGNVSPLTRAATDLGRMNGAMQLKNVTLLFNQSSSQKSEMQALIREQQDPSSPNYHQWLTPEQYAERFGMSQADLDKVTAWLKSQGFTAVSVSRGRTEISFSGTVAQVESVFQTEMHQYQLNGEMHLANGTEPSIPSALSGTIMGIRKLNDFRWKARAVSHVLPRFNSGIGTTLAPADVATIYDANSLLNSGIDGKGQRIAVVGQTSVNLSDINAFRSAAGLPVNPPVLFLLPGATNFVNMGDEVEADLDLEWAGALAKNATIIYVYLPENQGNGVVDAFAFAIDNDIAPIVSISYGACEPANGPTFVSFLQTEMQRARTQGQTVISAIGDSGATDCEPASKTATAATTGLTVDLPGAIPEVTAVGGTRFTSDDNGNPTFWSPSNDPTTGQSAIKYIPEATWDDGFTSATGGGVSSLIAKPSFQTALTPADSHRDVPDIALSASPNHDPYLVCDSNRSAPCTGGSFSTAFFVGGTSAGAPIFASMLTLLNQATENAGGQGAINPTLYSLAGVPATYASAFHDVTTGNNKQLCQGGSTGCTSANSHVVAESRHSGLPFNAVWFLIPVGAVVASAGRKRWSAAAGMVILAIAFSVQIACGGGTSSNSNNNTPPPNLMIGWSAGPGYDLTTGLGSVDLANLANAWPGFTTSPAFQLDQTVVTPPTTSTPGTFTITLTRTNSGFSGNVNLTCVGTGNATGDPLASCSLNPTVATLNSATPATSTLTFNATKSGTYSVLVTGQSGAISHSVNVPVTVP